MRHLSTVRPPVPSVRLDKSQLQFLLPSETNPATSFNQPSEEQPLPFEEIPQEISVVSSPLMAPEEKNKTERKTATTRGNESIRRIVVDTESMQHRVNPESTQHRINIPEVMLHLRVCIPEYLFLDNPSCGECDVIVSVKVIVSENGYPWNAAKKMIDQINRMRKSQGFSELSEKDQELICSLSLSALLTSMRQFYKKVALTENPEYLSLYKYLKISSLEPKINLVLPPFLCNRNAHSSETLKMEFPISLQYLSESEAAVDLTERLLSALKLLWDQSGTPPLTPEEEMQYSEELSEFLELKVFSYVSIFLCLVTTARI